MMSEIKIQDRDLEMLKHAVFMKVAEKNAMNQKEVRDLFAKFTDRGRIQIQR
jgi:hypothetical protein